MSKILVACEESQAVTKELRRLGHEAFSCDIMECSGGHPEWHLQQDVLPLLKDKWDMILAFPPCTHLAVSGARHFEKKEPMAARILFFEKGKEDMMNCVQVIGRITADPEVKVSQSGKSILVFSLAVQRDYKNRSGEYDTDFFRCVAYQSLRITLGSTRKKEICWP